MRTIVWFAYFWIYLLFQNGKLKRARELDAEGRVEERDALVTTVIQKWASSLLRVAGCDVTVEGLENIPDEPVLFVGNHQSNFDIPIVLAHLDHPHPLLSKIETKKIPLIRSWMEMLLCVFVDRNNPRQSVASLNEVIKLVEQGYSAVIFPEGTRSKGDTVGEFKSGAFRVAQKTKAKIVPIVIDGSYKVMEQNHNMIKPAKVKLSILPAMDVSAYSKEDFKLLPEQVKNKIVTYKNIVH